MDDREAAVNSVLSTFGNAYFSGLALEELWECIMLSTCPEELDAAVSATIRLRELAQKTRDKET